MSDDDSYEQFPSMCGEGFCHCNNDDNDCELDLNPIGKAFDYINKVLEYEKRKLLTWDDFIEYGKKQNKKKVKK
jgi:hypothetical protein